MPTNSEINTLNQAAMAVETVALVGASGHLGPSILESLRSSTKLEVTVLLRQSSKSTFPSSVKTVRIPDNLEPQETLIEALKGQDALVLAFAGSSTTQSKTLIDAAINAGVKHIIPADFGSCDSSDPRSLELVPLFKEKKKVRDYLISHEGQGKGKMSWTSIVTGHFFDYGLMTGLLGIDVKGKKARVFDGGKKEWSATTLHTIGESVRSTLELGDNIGTKNKLVYVQGVRTSQDALIGILEKLTGEKFNVEYIDSEEFIKEHKPKLYKSDGTLNQEVLEDLVGVEGIVNADWEHAETLVNDLLGFPTEKVEDVVRKALQAQS